MLMVNQHSGFGAVHYPLPSFSYRETNAITTNVAGGSAQYSFASVDIGSATNRSAVAIIIHVRFGGASSGLSEGLTIGGVAATKVSQGGVRSGAQQAITQIWVASAADLVAGGVTGASATVVYTAPENCACGGYSSYALYNLRSAVPTSTNNSPSNSGAIDVTALESGIIIAGGTTTNNAAVTYTPPSGFNEDYDGLTETNISYKTGASLQVNGGGLRTVSFTASAGTEFGFAAAAFR